jgi:hypothetical protein
MRTALALLAALLAPLQAAPQGEPNVRVHLLDGRTVRGATLTPKGGKLEVLQPLDEVVTLDLADVLEAHVKSSSATPVSSPGAGVGAIAVEVELVNRDLLRGALFRGLGETGFVVRSPVLGDVEVSLDVVSAVRFRAAYAKADDPRAIVAEKSDLFVSVTGDTIEGTLRSVTPQEIRVRAAGGQERILRCDTLLGFALVPLLPPGEKRKAEEGLRVQLALVDGSRISGSGVETGEKGWTLLGTADGKDRLVPTSGIEGLAVRGGRGRALPDLEPAAVEVKPYWGDDPPVLKLEPRVDRAFTLDRGTPPPLRLGGRPYWRGLSAFSGTTVRYDLEGKGFRSFVASVGVDDAGPKGAVEFEVLLDGKRAWKSGVVRPLAPGAEPLAMPPLDVSKAKSLTLVVHAGPGDDVQDFADFVKAALLP